MVKKILKTTFFMLAITLMLGSTAFAQEEDNVDDLANLSLEELLNTPIKTGSFLSLDLTKSPVSITIIDKKQIKESGSRTLSELLEIYVPGFQYMVNKWNGDIWGIRGVAVDRNTKIIFLVNGLKMNHESRDGAFSEISLGLLGDVERIEVLRGPSGLVYGSGAIAGVVNLVTVQPDKTSGNVSYSFGSWNSQVAEALSHSEFGDNSSLTVSVGARKSDGLGNSNSRIYGSNSWPTDGAVSPNGEPADGSAWYTPGNYRVGVDLKIDNFRLYSRLTHQRETAGGYFQLDPWPEIEGKPTETALPKTVDGKVITYQSPLANVDTSTARRNYLVDNISLDASYDYDIDNDKLKFQAAFVGVTNRTQIEYRQGYQVPNILQKADFIDQSFGEKRYLLSSQYLMNRFDNLNSAFGLEFRIDDLGKDLDGINMYGGNAKHLDISNVLYTNLALYTENLYNLNTDFGEFNFIGGLRFDKHTRTDGIFSPKLATVYLPNPDHAIKLIFQGSSNNGSADNYEYKYTHYDDEGNIRTNSYLATETDPNSTVIPAVTDALLHSLKPESILSYELTSTHKFMKNLTLSPSLSYNSVSNLFVWNQSLMRVVNGGQFNFVNAEAELKYKNDFLSLGFSHTFQRPVNTDVNQKMTFEIPATNVIENPNKAGTYMAVEIPNQTKTIEATPIKDQITRDGVNFLNLATHISKLYMTFTPSFYEPLSFMSVSTNLRVFWGLPGRTDLYAEDIKKGENYLNIDKMPMIKWNAGLHFNLPSDYNLSLYVYDILGQSTSLNAVRWQQSAFADQKDLYTVDQRSFAIKLEKTF